MQHKNVQLASTTHPFTEAHNKESQNHTTRHRRESNQSDRTGNIALIVIAFAAAIVIVVGNILFLGEHEAQEFELKDSYVKWEFVNLREGHNVGTPEIAQLEKGDRVKLTSQVFEAWDTEWIYIHSDKGDGWVVTASLQKP